MNIENIRVGETYKYKELCELLGVKCETATNKRVELYEEFQRYFDYEKVNKQNFLITKIYDNPLPGLENGFFYKTMIIPVKCSKEDYQYLLLCAYAFVLQLAHKMIITSRTITQQFPKHQKQPSRKQQLIQLP